MTSSSVIELDMGGPMNALSASPDWTHIVVAGRDVFKIVKVLLFLKIEKTVPSFDRSIFISKNYFSFIQNNKFLYIKIIHVYMYI